MLLLLVCLSNSWFWVSGALFLFSPCLRLHSLSLSLIKLTWPGTWPAPEKAAANYHSAHFKSLAVASCQRQTVLHVMVGASTSATPCSAHLLASLFFGFLPERKLAAPAADLTPSLLSAWTGQQSQLNKQPKFAHILAAGCWIFTVIIRAHGTVSTIGRHVRH